MFKQKLVVIITACVMAGLAAGTIADTNLKHDEAERSAMKDREIRAALKRHWSDIENQDVTHEIYHDDVVLEFPQSGERFLGLANLRAMRENYPAKVSATIRQSRGVGDLWVTELVITYDGKKQANAVSIMEFRAGMVARETFVFWGSMGAASVARSMGGADEVRSRGSFVQWRSGVERFIVQQSPFACS